MKKYISPCALFFGVLTLAASVFIGYYLVPYKVWENVMQQSKIIEGNTRFINWQKIPVPLFQKIYFFNVTNPDVVAQGGKPVLHEVGPYVYQQKREKFDIIFNEHNDTIFYKERTHYYFRQDLSNGSESDMLTFLNLPFVGVANKAAVMDRITLYIISDTLQAYPDIKLYLNITVGDLLFKGRYVPFMKELAKMHGEEILPNNTFGIYYNNNGSDAGRFEIYSGVKYPEKFGNVVSWNGMSKLNWWDDDEYCNRINGTDGALFRPFATKERDFVLFVPGLCKSLRFTFESDGMDVKGVPVLKYSIAPSFFESAKTNPDNACYCSNPGEDYKNCPENGIFQLAGCGKGSMILSQPHFYQGSELYVNQSVGLQPEKDRHEMALYIESYTSVSARIKLRFQMNVELIPNKFFKPLKKVPRMVHPLFWIDQNVEIPDDAATTLREKLYGTVNMANLLTHIGIIVGGALIVLSLLCFYLCSSNSTVHDGENKIECVSYHPQGTLTNGKVVLVPVNGVNGYNNTCTTNEPNAYDDNSHQNSDANSLVKQNGDLSTKLSTDLEQTELSTFSPTGGDVVDIDNTKICFESNMHLLESSPESSISSNPNKQPDSRLSPFPDMTDYASNLAITPADKNTLKDIVEATSSYENL